MALECCHFTVDVRWRWNVVTSLWMCVDAGMLSLHCECVVALECCHHCGCAETLKCCHFTVDVWWRCDAVTSLRMCGGAGMLSLHCRCVVALECCHVTVDVWWR